MKKIKITQKKSIIKCIPKHKSTIIGLGLKHIGHTVELNHTPEIIGMINSISYMIKIEK